MIRVRYNWLHIPQLCNHPHHQAEAFASGQDSMQFLDEREVLNQFARWNGDGAVRCYQYAVTGVESVHETTAGR